MKMIKVEITKELLIKAIQYAINCPIKYHENRDISPMIKRLIVGKLGELICTAHFGFLKKIESYDFDFISNITDKTFEVKTKAISCEPKPDYKVNLYCVNDYQKCDYYLFCMINTSFETGYILGFMEKNEFIERSEFYNAGEKDIETEKVYTHDAYAMKIKNLFQVD